MTPEVNKTTHPNRQYLSTGTRYIAFGSIPFEIVRWVPDAPGGGIVVVSWVERDGHPSHETDRPETRVEESELAPYIEQYGSEGGVVTADCIFRDMERGWIELAD